MRIQVTLSREEIKAFLQDFFPMRARLGKDGGDRRWLELEEPIDSVLAPEEGLRVHCHGRLRWPVALFPKAFTLQTLQVLLRPRLVQTGHGQALGFRLELEA